jgi:hypothetical protein
MAINLSSIATGQRIKPPKVCLYGVGGIGKTTFAAAAPNPIFLFTEEGQGRLDVPRFELRENDPVIRTWAELLECVGALYTEDHEYGTVVIDTLDFAEPLPWRHTAAIHSKDDIEAFGYGKGYIYACDEARILLQGLDALRNDKGMAIVLLAHSDTKKYEAPDHEPYDRYKLRLHDRLANLVHDWSDAMLFANWRVHVVKDTQGKGKGARETARGVGSGERVMFTEERPAWWAKNRYGLPFEMPLSWEALQEAIAAGVLPQKEVKKKTTARTKKAATVAATQES